MFKILKRNAGVSLIELISVMVISTILIVISAVGVSAFYKRYKITSDYIALQTEAMACLQTIRNGYGFNRGENFFGVANARKLEIIGMLWGVGSGVRITPPSSTNRDDWVSFYLDEGVIRMNYVYNGIGANRPQFIFPREAETDKIQVTRFVVSDANAFGEILSLDGFGSNDRPTLLHIELDARVKIRDGVRPAPDEYKTISYSTYMVKK